MTTRSSGIPWFLFLLAGLVPGHVESAQILEHHVPAAIPALNLRPAGQLPSSTQINLVIGLPWRNQNELTQLLRDLYNPASPGFHHYLTPRQFADRFSPTTNDYDALAAYFEAHGMRVTHKHPSRMLLDVSGAASAVNALFHVHLLKYRHPVDARDFYAPDQEPSVDAPVRILDINGLDNFASRGSYVNVDTNFQAGPGGAKPNGGSGIAGLYSGYDFRDAYLPKVNLTGAGQVVGLFEMDGYRPSDVTAYEQQAGLSNVLVTNVFLDSISNNTAGANSLEVTLDIDMAVAMAPGISAVIVYEGTNSADILDRMATDDLANQLSSSWKPFDASALTDQALEELAAQGQTMFQASGDSDSEPALDMTQPSSPYETLVGGTSLTTSGGLGSWVAESAWNKGASTGTGSGGGISTVYPIPFWQTNFITAANQGSTAFRNSPDVAMVASNVLVVLNGISSKVGGTSIAAPLWAGLTALINQQAAQNGLSPVGYLNPSLYGIALGPNYHSCFHDITTGNNFGTNSSTEFSAEPGYDLCTGLGTPAGQNLINALMPVLTIAPSQNQVTIGWPLIWTNAMLQQNATLTTTNWVAVTNAAKVANDQFQVTVTPAGTNEFFRLIAP